MIRAVAAYSCGRRRRASPSFWGFSRARIALPRKSVLAVRANPHGMCPRIQFRVADDREDTRNREVVIVPCFSVRRVAIELAQGVSRSGYEPAERDDWLLFFFG